MDKVKSDVKLSVVIVSYKCLEYLKQCIGIVWPGVTGQYNGTASADGYSLMDGTSLNLSDKDQKWDVLCTL